MNVDAYQRVNFLDIYEECERELPDWEAERGEKQKVEEVIHSIRAKDGGAVGGGTPIPNTPNRTDGLRDQDTRWHWAGSKGPV